MKRFLRNTNFLLISILAICFILFLPGFFTYFHQDDFIHFSYSQSLNQVISAFNIFHKGEFPFYRPIPTQLYFYLGKAFLGFNPLGYHIINFLIFSLNVFLVFRFAKLISKKANIAIIATIIFAINSTHFAPLYSAAYVHELLYILFGILTVDSLLRWIIYKKLIYYIGSVGFFVFALMTKETAVVLPAIIGLTYLFTDRKRKVKELIKVLFPFLAILGTYLYAHFTYYGIASGPSYVFTLGKQTLNILGWYFLWALSTPNILIDFIGPGLRTNPVFFQVSQYQGSIYFTLFPLLLFIGLILFVRIISIAVKEKENNHLKFIFWGACWFVIGMIPLIIFPLHKLATEQAFSLVGLSIGLAFLLSSSMNSQSKYRILSFLFIVIYFVIAVNSILLGRRTHWIVRSAQQAENVINFVKTYYPNLADNTTIYFRNGQVKIAPYGSSRQLYQALGNGVGLKLILNKPNIKLYFEDISDLPRNLNPKSEVITLDSSKFLGY